MFKKESSYFLGSRTIEDGDEIYPINTTNVLPVPTPNLLKAIPQNGTPYNYFRMILTDDMIKLLITNANQGLNQKRWKNLDINDFLTAIALYLYTGTLELPHINEYWSSDDNFNGLLATNFPLIMKRNRFLDIIKALFFSADNKLTFVSSLLDIYNEAMYDILEESKPKLTMTGLCPVFRDCYVELSMVVDESGVPSKYLITNYDYEMVRKKHSPVLQTFKKPVTILWPVEGITVISEKDENDILAYYPINIPGLKYYQKIGLHLFHLILMSSYYFYNSYENNKLNLHEYRLTLFQSLFIESSFSFQNRSYLGLVRLELTTGHFPVRVEKIKAFRYLKCRNCSNNKIIKNAHFYCSGCSGPQMVGLCLLCFEKFH